MSTDTTPDVPSTATSTLPPSLGWFLLSSIAIAIIGSGLALFTNGEEPFAPQYRLTHTVWIVGVGSVMLFASCLTLLAAIWCVFRHRGRAKVTAAVILAITLFCLLVGVLSVIQAFDTYFYGLIEYGGFSP